MSIVRRLTRGLRLNGAGTGLDFGFWRDCEEGVGDVGILDDRCVDFGGVITGCWFVEDE